jgi:hypothetical protein
VQYRIIPVDANRNPTRYSGRLCYRFTLNGDLEVAAGQREVEIAPYQWDTLRFTPREQGILRLYLDAEGLEGVSFPTLVALDAPSFYHWWGDLHIHTNCSDGYGMPGEALHYARDVLGHDFAALADHDASLSLAMPGGALRWEAYLGALQNFYQPGVFTTLLGHEISYPLSVLIGHRNMYVGGDTHYPYSRLSDFQNPEELFKVVRGEKALLIPHHPIKQGSMGTDWDFHDESVERLVEVYSGWGSSEKVETFEVAEVPEKARSVMAALERGYHLGFVAGSDEHAGRASNVTYDQGKKYGSHSLRYRSGTTCILAAQNTRSALFESLWNRRCYAISGENRMLIDFSIDDHLMGSILSSRGTGRLIRFSVAAMDEVVRVDVVKNGRDHSTFKPKALDFSNVVVDQHPERREDYYYLRVTTRARDRGWSSPIWVRNR